MAREREQTYWSDAELDLLEREWHAHSYIETIDSKREGFRIFKCVDCGKQREVYRRTVAMPGKPERV